MVFISWFLTVCSVTRGRLLNCKHFNIGLNVCFSEYDLTTLIKIMFKIFNFVLHFSLDENCAAKKQFNLLNVGIYPTNHAYEVR